MTKICVVLSLYAVPEVSELNSFYLGTVPISPLQLGKIGEKIYKVFKFWSNTP